MVDDGGFIEAPPKSLPRHSCIGSTLPLTETSVSTDLPGVTQRSSASPRVHGNWLADDEAIGDEFTDGLAGIGVADLVDFVGVEPDLSLAAADDRGREALLSTKVDPRRRGKRCQRLAKGIVNGFGEGGSQMRRRKVARLVATVSSRVAESEAASSNTGKRLLMIRTS